VVTEAPRRDYWPTAEWQTTSPEVVGLDPARLAEMDAYASDSLPPIRGILVVRHARIAFERYYDGCTQQSYHSVNSVTKSVLSALIGIAFRKGILTSLDQPLLDFFPELERVKDDPRKQTLTLRHLLTMTSGFKIAGIGRPLHERLLPDSPNLIESAFALPLAAPPGETFNYDDLSCHLLSVMLARLTGQSTAAFAEQELFRPLGIWTSQPTRFVWKEDRGQRDVFHFFGNWPEDGRPWKIDQHGHTLGSLGLHLTLREMATFGYLYLNGGRWDGEEIVPGWFVEESSRAQNPGGRLLPPADSMYGYLWWVSTGGVYFVSGYGGQFVFVMPQRDMVVAISTTLIRNWPQGILGRFINPAVIA
jgi:CubicO group peptidase (beta-lactamase class C family)